MNGTQILSVAELLKRREAARQKELIGMLIIGVALSFVLPILLGSLAYGAYRQYAQGEGSWMLWLLFVVLFAAIFTPLLLLKEKANIAPDAAIIRTQEDERGRRVISVMQSDIDLQSFGPLGMQISDDQSITGHWFFRPLFLGPRMIVRAMPQRKILRMLTKNTNIPRAAEVLAKLASRQDGIATEVLLHPDESPDILTPTLAYLRQLDWVDCSSDGSRIWLNSAFRDEVSTALQKFAPEDDSTPIK